MFTEIIEDLYKKISEEVIDEDLVYENVSPSSNSDSGIFKDSAGGTAAAVAGVEGEDMLDCEAIHMANVKIATR